MRCLCCDRPIGDGASEIERESCWHTSCIRRFFGTSEFPPIDISRSNLETIVGETIERGSTVPGVQKKISLRLESGRRTRLTLTDYPSGYILKPQTEEYEALPEAEFLAMSMARATGIRTVPFALVKLGEELAYITRRIDREKGEMLAMEDFCQLEGRLTEDKYRGSYERCAKVVSRYSVRLGFDLSELFLRLVFSFAVGNSDMHLKNFSLIEEKPGKQRYVLSPAYDMLPVNTILPADREQMALTLNGKKQNLRRKDFLVFADSAGIPRAAAEKIIAGVISLRDTYISMCEEGYLPERMKRDLIELMEERIQVLKG